MVHLVTAIIKPHKLEEVKEAIREPGRPGSDGQRGPGVWVPGRQERDLPRLGVPGRVRAEGQDGAPRRLGHRRQGVRDRSPTPPALGKIGDGKVWSVEVGQAMRVRTGELGADALEADVDDRVRASCRRVGHRRGRGVRRGGGTGVPDPPPDGWRAGRPLPRRARPVRHPATIVGAIRDVRLPAPGVTTDGPAPAGASLAVVLLLVLLRFGVAVGDGAPHRTLV